MQQLRSFSRVSRGDEESGTNWESSTDIYQFSSVQLLSHVRLFVTPWKPGLPVHHQSQSLLKLMSTKSVMPSNHLILCCPLLPLSSSFPSIRIFSNESVLHIRWPKYWRASASASVLPMNIQDWFPLGWTGWISLQSKELSRVFSNTTVQKHQFFNTAFYGPTLTSIHDYWKNHSFD